jgi:hypothetical protein
MGEVWIKEAERLTPAGNHNAMSGIGGPRATLHCTVSFPGSFAAMHRVLTSKTSEPHLLYDPKTDRLGQYFPLDRAARALARGTLGYSHNKVGSVNIQIEVCEMPRDWTTTPDWNPGPNFRAMIRAIRSHGIKDELVFRFAKSGTDRANVVRPDRLLTSTEGGGKWWGHCHYGQGESHYDPGPIDVARFFAAAPNPTTAPAGGFLMALTDQQQTDLYNRVMGGIPDGKAAGRKDSLGRPTRILDTADGETIVGKSLDPAKVAAAVAAVLPAGSAVTDAQLESALRKVLGSVDGVTA